MWLPRFIAKLLLGLLLLVGVVAIGVNTPAGLSAIASAARLGGVEIEGLAGHFPDDLSASKVTVADAGGVWLEIDALHLAWSPWALLEHDIHASVLTADRVHVARYPGGGSDSSSSDSFPYRVIADTVKVGQVELPEISFSLEGRTDYQSSALDVALTAASADAFGQGPVTLAATLKGPTQTAVLDGSLTAMGATMDAKGPLDLDKLTASLDLDVRHLAISGTSAEDIAVHAEGGVDALKLHSVITGLVVPGVQPAMIGDAPVTLDATYRKGGAPEFTASLSGATLTLTTQGDVPTSALALDAHLHVLDLAAFAPGVAGQATLDGRIDGGFDDFAVKAHANADITAQGTASTIAASIDANGLPARPIGDVSAHGSYGGQPVAIDAKAVLDDTGHHRIDITQASFQGIDAKGSFILADDGGLPSGQIDLVASSLPGTTAGSAKASLGLSRDGATPLLKVTADVANAVASGTRIGRFALSGTVTDPLGTTPTLAATATASGVSTGPYKQDIRLDVTGPATALAIRLGVSGTATVSAAATLDAINSTLVLSSLSGAAQGETLRLAAPTTITYAPQVTLGATRITLAGSSLDIAGQVSPTLNLTANLRAVPSELVRLVDPSLHAEGSITAQARLQGTTSNPTGTLQLTGDGLRLRSPPGLPPVSVSAQATLAGAQAQVNVHLSAANTTLTVAGSVPTRAGGAFNVTAKGRANLGQLDPYLAAAGIQTRGQIVLDGALTGTGPQPSGTLTLQGASLTVPADGARLSDINASVQAGPDGIVLQSLTAKAGTGTISANGHLDLTGTMPLAFSLTARGATPISSDLLTTKFDADLKLDGALQTAMDATGTIRISRADINIPQSLPSSLPQLTFRTKGAPPPPPAPPVPIRLDITLSAADQIYLHGRGLEAELAGKLRITGTADDPTPVGGFTLKRGQYSLAGQALNFSTGRVGFDGHLPIDPTLDFTAVSATTAVVATLAITGTANHPHIGLSSVPELPQDEVLAQLLFRRSAAELGPVQLAQIGAGLAQLANIGGAGSFDPLGTIRKTLGLDVLSVNSNPGSAASVEAGRTIAKGVYVGAKQSTGGTGSQAVVRLDLARGLKLEADLGVAPAAAATPTPGAPPTGNQVGITYEFDY